MAIERFGPARELKPMELPDPKVRPDIILVRVAAPLEDAGRAQERIEEGHVRGKLVLRVHP
jgi:hypothetical protein